MNATAGSIISSAIYYCGSITLFPTHVKSGNFYAGSPIHSRLSIGDGGFSQASEKRLGNCDRCRAPLRICWHSIDRPNKRYWRRYLGMKCAGWWNSLMLQHDLATHITNNEWAKFQLNWFSPFSLIVINLNVSEKMFLLLGNLCTP